MKIQNLDREWYEAMMKQYPISIVVDVVVDGAVLMWTLCVVCISLAVELFLHLEVN